MLCENTLPKSLLCVILAIFFLLLFHQPLFASKGEDDKEILTDYLGGWVEWGAPLEDVEIRVYSSTGRLINKRFPIPSVLMKVRHLPLD